MLTKEQVTQVLESAEFESLPDYAVNFLEGEGEEVSAEDYTKCVDLAESIVRARPDLKLETWPASIPPL